MHCGPLCRHIDLAGRLLYEIFLRRNILFCIVYTYYLIVTFDYRIDPVDIPLAMFCQGKKNLLDRYYNLYSDSQHPQWIHIYLQGKCMDMQFFVRVSR